MRETSAAQARHSWTAGVNYKVFFLAFTLFFGLSGKLVRSANAAADSGDALEERYQDLMIRDAQVENHLTPDSKPEGKTIERIIVKTNDVIQDNDPWPHFMNDFHAMTHDEIIRQELLFNTGDKWTSELISETSRNLRNNLFLAVAQIRAYQGSTPDKVVAVVVTKDLWSLRLNSSFAFGDSKLQVLDLELAEFNLGGKNRKVGVNFFEDLGQFSGGLEFSDPRIGGTRIGLVEHGSLIFNRDSHALEGGTQSLSIGQPLYSLETEWAWNALISYRKDVSRLFRGGVLDTVLIPSTGESVPYSYQRQLWDMKASATRSFGRDLKQDLSFGWQGYVRNYSLPGASPGISAASLTAFQNTYEPLSENAGMLFLSYHRYVPRYVTLEDINTYALTEDFKLGPDYIFVTRFSSPAFGFSSTYFQPVASLGYTWYTGDDLLTIASSASVRYQTGIFQNTNWISRSLTLFARNASPRFSIFRFHNALQLIRQDQPIDHAIVALGGDSLLRGFPTNYLVGSSLWAANFELRTLPWEFNTIYIGAAAFVDLGSAFDDPRSPGFSASTGAGLRMIFPQFNRHVLRLDVGVPLGPPAGVSPVSFVAQFGQAFN